jgi:DNA-binding CsgD family transcriptional regulator
MIDLPLLRRLADAAGIGTAYRDAFGRQRDVPAETLAATLEVIGVHAGSPDEAAAGIAALEEAPWRDALDPVAVRLDEEERPEIPVALPAGSEGSTLEWRLLLEDGGERSGGAAVGGLRELERREIGGRALVRRALALPGPLEDAGRLRAGLAPDGEAGRLTARELEVARLVADACTNQQIAQRLFLSVRTVESHVRSALAKLGFSTRTELALWVRDVADR